MATIVVNGDSDYELNLNNIRYLLDPSVDSKDFPDNIIDSIVYMQLVEDRLLALIPDADDIQHIDRPYILRYVFYGTALLLLPKFAQIIQEQEYGEVTRYATVAIDEIRKILTDGFAESSTVLGLTVTTVSGDINIDVQLTTSRAVY